MVLSFQSSVLEDTGCPVIRPIPSVYHFFTPNAYLCTEINAHDIVMVLARLKKDGTPQLFKPWLFSSQPCESFFKACLSFTPVVST